MKRAISAAALAAVLLVTALSAVGGALRWDIAAALIAVLCCVPFFLSFEKRAPSASELVLCAVMTAFSAAGRFIFAPLPFFKPVTAITVLTGMLLSPQAGFMTGALSAVVSNIWFGQGAWTPFQMLSWGLIGYAAGLLNRRKWLEKPIWLCVFGVVAGGFYSLVMDVWTALSADGAFTIARWLALSAAALPVTAVYCVSNVIFLLVLRKPLTKRIAWLKEKYGVFENR